MVQNFLKFYFLLFILLGSLSAFAVNGQKNIGFSTSLTFLSSLYETNDYRYTATSLYSIAGSYTLSQDHALSLGFQGTKNLSGDFRANDETLILGHSQIMGRLNDISFTTGQSISTPINKKSRRDDTLKYAVAVNASASKPFDFIFPTGTSLSLAAKKNFHKFETNADRKYNISYLFKLSPSVSFELIDKLGFNLAASLIEAFDYAGARQESYSFDSSLSYAFTEQFNTSLGLSIGGATYINRGNDSNIQLFDSQASEVYLAMLYSF